MGTCPLPALLCAPRDWLGWKPLVTKWLRKQHYQDAFSFSLVLCFSFIASFRYSLWLGHWHIYITVIDAFGYSFGYQGNFSPSYPLGETSMDDSSRDCVAWTDLVILHHTFAYEELHLQIMAEESQTTSREGAWVASGLTLSCFSFHCPNMGQIGPSSPHCLPQSAFPMLVLFSRSCYSNIQIKGKGSFCEKQNVYQCAEQGHYNAGFIPLFLISYILQVFISVAKIANS